MPLKCTQCFCLLPDKVKLISSSTAQMSRYVDTAQFSIVKAEAYVVLCRHSSIETTRIRDI